MNKIGTCARCGCDINIHEFVHNTKMFIVLKSKMILHFCSYCVDLIKERKREIE